MRAILTISHDEMLLATRAAVLRKTKAEVVAATANEAKKILKTRQFDLVVLCHSLSIEETLEIASLAHQQTSQCQSSESSRMPIPFRSGDSSRRTQWLRVIQRRSSKR
jgi:DNA-binding response OmpR family regulator